MSTEYCESDFGNTFNYYFEKPEKKYSIFLQWLLSSVFQEEFEDIQVSNLNPCIVKCQNNNSNYLITIIDHLSHDDIQNIIQKLSHNYNFKNITIKKQICYTLVRNTWTILIKEDFFLKVNLLNFLAKAIYTKSKKIPLETTLNLIINLVTISLKILEKNPCFNNITMKNIFFIYKESKILSTTPQISFDFCSFDTVNDILTKNNYDERSCCNCLQKIALIFYCCLTLTVEYGDFIELMNKNPDLLIKNLPKIPGIEYFFNKFMNLDIKDIAKNKYFKTCAYILDPKGNLANPSIPALLGAFYFTNKFISLTAFDILASNLDLFKSTENELFTFKIQSKIIAFLNKFDSFDKKNCLFTIVFISKVLNYKKGIYFSHSIILFHKLASCKSLDLADQEIRKELLALLQQMKNIPTLTIVNILNKANIFENLLSQYYEESKFILKFLPFSGFNALDTIKNLKKINVHAYNFKCINLLYLIPIHFRLGQTFSIMDLIEEIINIYMKNLFSVQEKVKILRIIMKIVYELMHAGKECKKFNLDGCCYKNSQKYRVSPIMLECKSCNSLYCLSCGQLHANALHEVEYLTHSMLAKKSKLECKGKDIEYNEKEYNFNQQLIPAFTIFSLDNKVCENDYDVYTSQEILISNTTETHISYYTELSFEELNSEDLIINIINTGITFNNYLTQCKKNNIFICKMPHIGDYDTLGLGFTTDKYLFFTYNGFRLGKFIEFTADVVKIEVKIRNFLGKAVVKNPDYSIYTGEGFFYMEKLMILKYPNILKSYKILMKMHKNNYKLIDTTKDLIVLDIKDLYSESDVKNIIKEMKCEEKDKKECRTF
ncbi:hypothetical protein SteCoe_11070 [Stentor coeruleus]|uniref:Uncharacterized protein n=1 Tax=Stentor coeruleus TaxID=5963 RepID=A0A1R2CDZ9_9CILI|nr:hypothetical protein SteCoe_11070 [Stentor coeruleus]